MPLDDELRVLAARQYGLVTREQARALGATRSGVKSRLLGPDWEAPTPRVLRLCGAPAGVRQDLMLAVLDAGPGAVVSHGTAAALWRLPGFSFAPPHVSRPRSRSTRASSVAVLHHPSSLPAAHVTERHGIPVTTLPRTVFDVAAGVHPGRLERIIDSIVAKAPTVLPLLHQILDDLAASGRPGVAPMRAALATRSPGHVPVQSGLEARLERFLAAAGEAPLERQVDVGGHEWIGRVDFLDRALRIVVEVDSDLHHSSALDRAADRRRDEALRRAGWVDVVRITEDDVWRRPDVAIRLVRNARQRARRVLVSESCATAHDSDTGTFERAGA